MQVDIFSCGHTDIPLAGSSVTVTIWMIHRCQRALCANQILQSTTTRTLRKRECFLKSDSKRTKVLPSSNANVHTSEVIDVFANDVLNPGQVGGGTSEDAGLLIKDTADWTKTSDAVHLPRGRGAVLAYQGSTRVTLSH